MNWWMAASFLGGAGLVTTLLFAHPVSSATTGNGDLLLVADEVLEVHLDYGWSGKAKRSRRNLVAEVVRTKAGWIRTVSRRDFTPVREQSVVNDGELAIVEVAQALSGVHPSQRMQRCTSHTDDYPELKVRIVVRDGREIRLQTRSNCPHLSPWNVTNGKALFVLTDSGLATPLAALLGWPQSFGGRGPMPDTQQAEIADDGSFAVVFRRLEALVHRLMIVEGAPVSQGIYRVGPTFAALVWMDRERCLAGLKERMRDRTRSSKEKEMFQELAGYLQ